MKKFFLALIVLGWLVPCGAAQQNSATGAASSQSGKKETVVEEIVARVNNSIITRSELNHNLAQIRQDAKRENLPENELKKREADSLRDLIDQQLLLQKASELGISADADLIKRLDDLRKQLKVGSMEELQKMAEAQGVSWEEFKQNTKNSILTQKVIGSEVGEHIQITQDEIKSYYDRHKDKFTQPQRVRLSEILVAADPNALPGALSEPTQAQVDAAREKAAKIYAQLQAGASFDELARKDSNGPTAAQGGDLGYFKRHDLALQLEAKTFDLKIGGFTAPIRTRQGFLILRVTDRIEAGTTPLNRVRDQIQDQIYRKRIQPALRAYLTKLRSQAYVEVRSGYTDTGAGDSRASIVYATDSGPVTKQVRGRFGFGKKTVIVEDNETPEEAEANQEANQEADAEASGGSKSEATGSSMGGSTENQESSTHIKAYANLPVLDAAKARLRDAEDAEAEATTPAQKAAAKARFDAAEKEMLAHMSHREQRAYFKNKKKEAEKEAQRLLKEKRKQKELTQKRAQQKTEKKEAAERKAHGSRHKKHAMSASKGHSGHASKSAKKEQANANQPASTNKKKKKFSWF